MQEHILGLSRAARVTLRFPVPVTLANDIGGHVLEAVTLRSMLQHVMMCAERLF